MFCIINGDFISVHMHNMRCVHYKILCSAVQAVVHIISSFIIRSLRAKLAHDDDTTIQFETFFNGQWYVL